MEIARPIRKEHLTCRLCEATGEYPVLKLREMMYGTREEFDYFQCENCGGLQICNIPPDLSRHYPPDYYSQVIRTEPLVAKGIKAAIVRWYCRSAVTRPKSALGKLVRGVLPTPVDFTSFGQYLVEANLRKCSDKILDVGCGASPYVLAAFHRCGFHALEGIDPFIAKDTEYFGIPVYRKTIDQMQGIYALIMFHHSLEHVPDPIDSLRHAARLLRPGGTCILRIPVMDTYFWRTFGINWVELDAPRHLYLMAVRTINTIAGRTGFKLRKTIFDSQGWELAASYQYADNIPLRAKESDVFSTTPTRFSSDQLRAFDVQTTELNRAADAGRACFYLDRI